jgi:hypothetical protein
MPIILNVYSISNDSIGEQLAFRWTADFARYYPKSI